MLRVGHGGEHWVTTAMLAHVQRAPHGPKWADNVVVDVPVALLGRLRGRPEDGALHPTDTEVNFHGLLFLARRHVGRMDPLRSAKYRYNLTAVSFRKRLRHGVIDSPQMVASPVPLEERVAGMPLRSPPLARCAHAPPSPPEGRPRRALHARAGSRPGWPCARA